MLDSGFETCTTTAYDAMLEQQEYETLKAFQDARRLLVNLMRETSGEGYAILQRAWEHLAK